MMLDKIMKGLKIDGETILKESELKIKPKIKGAMKFHVNIVKKILSLFALILRIE